MAAPITVEAWDRLTEATREFDKHGGYQLLRWLDLVLKLGQPTHDLVTGTDYDEDDAASGVLATLPDGSQRRTSLLGDPYACPVEWLPWLAQVRGVVLPAGMSIEAQRAAIESGSSGWRSGNRASMEAAARTALTGGQFVSVDGFYLNDPFTLVVRTRASETPDSAALLDAVTRLAKPAGFVLVHRTYSSPWDVVEAVLPTWDQWEQHTWNEIEEINFEFAPDPVTGVPDVPAGGSLDDVISTVNALIQEATDGVL